MSLKKEPYDTPVPNFEEKPKKRNRESSKKRNRVPISCTICRRRKVKCDKRRPVCAACERTGVAHLCHYIDPLWAQPLSNQELTNGERTPEEEVERLREKVEQLEQQLQMQAEGHPELQQELHAEHNEGESSAEENENDSLNLNKKFDMLHIKSTTTVHLGATSWLAIMKGDPYLRVLWAHIFKMRKQVEEFKFRKQALKNSTGQTLMNAIPGHGHLANLTSNGAPMTPKGKCPVAHTEVFKSKPVSPEQKQDDVDSTAQTCPVSGKGMGMGKCPVAHDMETDESSEQSELVSGSASTTSSKRPREDDEDESEGTREDTESPRTEEDDRVCPLMIGDNSFLDQYKSADQDQSFENTHKRKKTRSNSNESSKSSGRKVSPEDFKANPVQMMQKYLPTKKVLWLFIERFFEVLYIYLPFVDEETFREDIKSIMGSPDDAEQDIKISIRSGIDFALLGTVCIILRLTWNTLPMNHSSKLLEKLPNMKTYHERNETLKILQQPENEIPLELVECVQHCFSNLKLMRKSSLKIVQCGLFMRFYFMYSPEDGDGADGGDSQIFLGMIVQMAISIGLHRDPKNFENFGNEKQRHLWRKIWFALLSLDCAQSVNLGCPRCLQGHQEFSDTMLPGSIKDGLDLEFKDDMRELSVIKMIHTQANLDSLVSKTMKVLLNVNTPAKRYQVDNLIKELQHSISGFGITKDEYALPQLGKILVHRTRGEPLFSSGTRALQFRAHVTVNMLIYLLNYILYVHFEPRGTQDPQMARLAKNYAQKALNSALEGYRNCALFFDCGLEYFGPGADLVLSPLVLLVGHRSMQFMVSLILRSRCGPFMKANVVASPVEGREDSIEPGKIQMRVDSDGMHSIDNTNHDLEDIEIRDDSERYSTFNVDVNSGETLATILLDHMIQFHQLSEQLGEKYPYSWRMAKAVSFFITLLKKPTNVVKTMVKTESVKNVENNTGEISNLLNSVPLVLSADEEELRKCPVFMKSEESATRSTVSQADTPKEKPSMPQFKRPSIQQSPDEQMQRMAMAQQQHPVQTPRSAAPSPAYDPIGRIFQQGGPLPEFIPSNGPVTSPFPLFMNGEMDGSAQFGEMGVPEAFVNFNEADKSLGDMFGVSLGNANSIAAAAEFMNEMANIDLEGGEVPMPNMDLNNMMNGNWFA